MHTGFLIDNVHSYSTISLLSKVGLQNCSWSLSVSYKGLNIIFLTEMFSCVFTSLSVHVSVKASGHSFVSDAVTICTTQPLQPLPRSSACRRQYCTVRYCRQPSIVMLQHPCNSLNPYSDIRLYSYTILTKNWEYSSWILLQTCLIVSSGYVQSGNLWFTAVHTNCTYDYKRTIDNTLCISECMTTH